MKKSIAVIAAAAAIAIAPSGAVAASGTAPGATIKEACGVSFGQLVSSGKSSGNAAHRNYAGGAKAFSAAPVLAAHGCAVNPSGAR
ncbi:MAG TPA: hypothetical protein VK919_03655 [Solirubrobacterales bacterium]|nr:hypothetical protein [Solirubrobacterales bacterium]